MAIGWVMILAIQPIVIYPGRVRDRRVEPGIWLSRLEGVRPAML
jgi:hypothetical protein